MKETEVNQTPVSLKHFSSIKQTSVPVRLFLNLCIKMADLVIRTCDPVITYANTTWYTKEFLWFSTFSTSAAGWAGSEARAGVSDKMLQVKCSAVSTPGVQTSQGRRVSVWTHKSTNRPLRFHSSLQTECKHSTELKNP